jgi:hypothetical protein
MPGQLLRLSDRLLNTPLLIHPAKAQIILGALSGRIGIDDGIFSLNEAAESPETNRFTGSSRRQSAARKSDD